VKKYALTLFAIPLAILAPSLAPSAAFAADMSGVLLREVPVPLTVSDPAAHERARVEAVIDRHQLDAAAFHRFEAVPAFAARLDEQARKRLAADPQIAAIVPIGDVESRSTKARAAILIHAGVGASSPCFAQAAPGGTANPRACNPSAEFNGNAGVISVAAPGALRIDGLSVLRALDWVAARAAEGSPDVPSGASIAVGATFSPCADPLARALSQSLIQTGQTLALAPGTVTSCLSDARRAAATISVVQTALPAVEGFRGGNFLPTSVAVTVKASAGTQRFTISGAPSWLPFAPTVRTATATGLRVVQPVSQAAARARAVGWHKSVLRFQNSAVSTNRVYRTAVLDVFGSVSAGRTAYNSRCLACHQLTTNGIGPRLSGIYKRRAGSASATGYTRYSAALAAYARRWNNELLTRFLTNPQALVPGSRMPSYSFLSVTERQNIVAYLRAISANAPQ
jgi:cytochrome c